jgi:hypothetical protein
LRELFIFDTESEKQEDLPSFIDDNWRYGMSTDPSRDPTAAVVQWFVKLHSLGFSLSGNFKATNFALNHSDLLRGERKLLKNLRKLTLKRRRRDMESCWDMIEFDFYNREYVRVSIATKHLLWLLKHCKPGYSCSLYAITPVMKRRTVGFLSLRPCVSDYTCWRRWTSPSTVGS